MSRTFAAIATAMALTLIAADKAKPKADNIQGSWELQTLDVNGQPANKKPASMIFVFKEDQLVMKIQPVAGSPVMEHNYKLSLSPEKNPSQLDFEGEFKNGMKRKAAGIYQIKDDKLRLALSNENVEERPTEFKSKSGTQLLTFKRIEASEQEQ